MVILIFFLTEIFLVMTSPQLNNNNLQKLEREDQKSMRMYKSKSVIWEMDAGLTITLHQRSKLDSTDHQKLSLVQIMIHQQMFGVLLAQSLRWLQEISYLNQEKVKTMIRMMIT